MAWQETFLLSVFLVSALLWLVLTARFLLKWKRSGAGEMRVVLGALLLVAFSYFFENLQYGLATAAKYGFFMPGLAFLNQPEWWAVPKLLVILAALVMLWTVRR